MYALGLASAEPAPWVWSGHMAILMYPFSPLLVMRGPRLRCQDHGIGENLQTNLTPSPLRPGCSPPSPPAVPHEPVGVGLVGLVLVIPFQGDGICGVEQVAVIRHQSHIHVPIVVADSDGEGDRELTVDASHTSGVIEDAAGVGHEVVVGVDVNHQRPQCQCSLQVRIKSPSLRCQVCHTMCVTELFFHCEITIRTSLTGVSLAIGISLTWR